MNNRNLTKEEMSEYIKVTNFLENNARDINYLLARDKTEFNKSGIYSNANWKMNIALRSFFLSLLIVLMFFAIPFLIFSDLTKDFQYGLFLLSTCSFFLFIVLLNFSYSTKKKFLKMKDLCLKEQFFYPKTNLENTLSKKDYETYLKLKAFFDYLVNIGYYNNYLTPEEVGKIRKIEKEREDISEKVKKSTEPVEKEFWKMKLKNFERENSKYLKLKENKEYA